MGMVSGAKVESAKRLLTRVGQQDGKTAAEGHPEQESGYTNTLSASLGEVRWLTDF